MNGARSFAGELARASAAAGRRLEERPAVERRLAPAPRTKHVFAGHINPRCIHCGRSPMEAQRDPFAVCLR